MLRRSFKSSKCKTSLRLAVARVKLLKNKMEAQLRPLKRELAQLLESGQERFARIRVEHVVREEKTIAVYYLIETYCELIVARLPIIESQKKCPIDLKEAISSVIFASPRCADVPELLDVRKHFTTKYGKRFISSAIELRPDCGVNRVMIEKLSARAPDDETKIKVLGTIAQEYDIRWKPTSLEEKDLKPPDDFLNGPSNFEDASKMYVELPNVKLMSTHDQKQESSVRPSENNARSTPSSQTFASPSGTGSDGREFKHSFSEDENAFSLNRQSWNMEFKGASSSARVAFESAERASMAAREALELSSSGEITRQYSTDTHKSSRHSFSEDENAFSLNRQKKKMEFQGESSAARAAVESAERASMAAKEGLELSSSGRITRQYSTDTHKSSTHSFSKDENAFSLNRQNRNMEFKDASSAARAAFETAERASMAAKGALELSVSFHSRVSDEDEDVFLNSDLQRHGSCDAGHSFISTDSRNMQKAFDESDSDDDCNLDVVGEYSGHHSSLLFPTSREKTFPRFLEDISTRSSENFSRQLQYSPEVHHPSGFAERVTKSTFALQWDYLFSTFYDSDSPSSESEEEMNECEFSERTESSGQPHKQSFNTRSSVLTQTDNHALNSEEILHDRKPETEMSIRDESMDKYDASSLSTKQTSDDAHQPTVSCTLETCVNSDACDQEAPNRKMQIKDHKDTSFRSPKTYFDSDSDDADELLPPRQAICTGEHITFFDSDSDDAETGAHSSFSVPSEASFNSDFRLGEKLYSRNSPLSKSQYLAGSSGSKVPSASYRTRSMPESSTSSRREAFRFSEVEPFKMPNSESLRGTEGLMTSTWYLDSSRGNSMKESIHVHPKLPDYDTLAARFGSLRSNKFSDYDELPDYDNLEARFESLRSYKVPENDPVTARLESLRSNKLTKLDTLADRWGGAVAARFESLRSNRL